MDTKKTFDLETMVAEQMGGTVLSNNPDGSVKIRVTGPDGKDSEKNLDVVKMLKDNGIDPKSVNIKYNSPESAATERDLSFATRVKLSLAEDPKSKLSVLSEEYGPENVKMGADNVPVVNENGVWKKADSSLMADLTSALPEVGGGLAGRAAGAKAGAIAGAFLGPVGAGVGAVVGGLAGGSLGSALAKVIKDKGAEVVGIKSEYDAEQAQEVLAKEFAWNMAIDTTLGAAGAAWRGFGKPLAKAAGKAIKGTAATLVEGGDKAAAAELLETMVNGTSRNDWITIMRTPRDAERVLGDMDKMVSWGKARATSSVIDPVDPLSSEMIDLAHTAMKGAKHRAMKNYAKGIEVLEKSGATAQAKVDVTQIASDFKSTLADLGLLEKSAEGPLRLARRPRPGSEGIMQVFDAKSIRTLETVYQQLDSVLRPVGGEGSDRIAPKPLGFQDAKKMLSGIDDILENSGMYNGGEAAMSNNARRALMKLRQDVNKAVTGSLGNIKLADADGRMISAADHYRKTAQSYSQFRELYDDYALPSSLGGKDQRVLSTVNSMLGEKGASIEQSFQRMLQAAGVDAQAVVPRMQQLRAARNLSDIYAPGSTGIGAVVKAHIGVGSPRAMAQSLAEKTVKAGEKPMKKLMPMSPQAKNWVEKTARLQQFYKSLPTDQAYKLVSDPVMMRELSKMYLQDDEPVTMEPMQ